MPDGGANAAAFAPVRDDVFGRIADRYDRLCDLFSLGAHRIWKRQLAKRMANTPGERVLDLASGTGDIPNRLIRRLGQGHSRDIWVTDLSPQMLALARVKLAFADPAPTLVIADAEMLLGFEDASFDVVSMAFGMKICDRAKATAEAFRVLRPGGTFLCLEAARIPLAPVHALYLAYMRLCLPIIARIATDGDRSAYDYLVRGVHAFPSQPVFAFELAETGFDEVSYENITFGIVALHVARKPG